MCAVCVFRRPLSRDQKYIVGLAYSMSQILEKEGGVVAALVAADCAWIDRYQTRVVDLAMRARSSRAVCALQCTLWRPLTLPMNP